MASEIQATPILYGKDAIRLGQEVEETNRKMQDPVHRSRVLKRLEEYAKLYLDFRARGIKDNSTAS